MRKFATVLLSGVLLASCGGNQVRAKRPAAPAEPKEYTYSVRAVHPHPATSYTQGLQYADGRLWEGTGQHGESVVQTLDLATGRAEVFARLPKEDFGEGIALLDGKVYQAHVAVEQSLCLRRPDGRETQGVPLSRRGLGTHDRREEGSTCRTARQTSTRSTRPPSNAKSAPP